MHPNYTGKYKIVVTKKPSTQKRGGASATWNKLMQHGKKEYHPADNFTTITLNCLGEFKYITRFYQKLNHPDVAPLVEQVVITYDTWTLTFDNIEFRNEFNKSLEASVMKMYQDPKNPLLMHFNSDNINVYRALLFESPTKKGWRNHFLINTKEQKHVWHGNEFLAYNLQKIAGIAPTTPRRKL